VRPTVGPVGRAAVARQGVDDQTELTHDGVDGRTDVAPARRDALLAPPTRADGHERDADHTDHVDYAAGPDVDDDADLDETVDDGLADDELDADDPDANHLDADDLDLDDLDAHDLDADDGEFDDPAVRPAQAWAGVVAQWLAGAVAGAVLWVLFRYLWRGLPVVALAAALLVTAGLVLLVRQLLHDVDRRTTGFAVLVGLLLTASPAVLVLLGR
jgi:hypothetical protein